MQLVTVSQPQSPAGRRLLQANNSSSGISANLEISITQNLEVNLTVQVPFADRNNVTGIVDDAVNSGEVRRGLQEAGECLPSHAH